MKLAGELDMLKLLLLPRDAPPLGDDTTILSFDPFPNIPTPPNPFVFALGVVGWWWFMVLVVMFECTSVCCR